MGTAVGTITSGGPLNILNFYPELEKSLSIATPRFLHVVTGGVAPATAKRYVPPPMAVSVYSGD